MLPSGCVVFDGTQMILHGLSPIDAASLFICFIPDGERYISSKNAIISSELLITSAVVKSSRYCFPDFVFIHSTLTGSLFSNAPRKWSAFDAWYTAPNFTFSSTGDCPSSDDVTIMSDAL